MLIYNNFGLYGGNYKKFCELEIENVSIRSENLFLEQKYIIYKIFEIFLHFLRIL